jgi:hypothetical protein
MSSFINYFAPLAQDERTPITQEPVKNGLRNRRSIARVARRRAIERQRTEDAQVEQHESLTCNNQAASQHLNINIENRLTVTLIMTSQLEQAIGVPGSQILSLSTYLPPQQPQC